MVNTSVLWGKCLSSVTLTPANTGSSAAVLRENRSFAGYDLDDLWRITRRTDVCFGPKLSFTQHMACAFPMRFFNLLLETFFSCSVNSFLNFLYCFDRYNFKRVFFFFFDKWILYEFRLVQSLQTLHNSPRNFWPKWVISWSLGLLKWPWLSTSNRLYRSLW